LKKYNEIIKHYESCLEKHGDTHLGVDWPIEEDVYKRYKVMMEILSLKYDKDNVTLLDLGCGTANLLEYKIKNGFENVIYSGMDISEKFVNVCKSKYPNTTFYCGDLLNPDFKLPSFDYVIMNGVFTEKRELTFEEMWEYFTQQLIKVFALSNKGIAFNVMSKQVDWEREDLFHVPLDLLADFLCKKISRNFVFRNDYGLYEYTVYIYKKAHE
jgi:SAM-dependent methyltransferase